MEIECRNQACKYCFECDCQLMTILIGENGQCLSFEEQESEAKAEP